MLFDTHAHYDDPAFDADRDAVLSALIDKGVGLVVIPGCTVDTSRQAVELAEKFPHVYAAVGVHPQDCGDFGDRALQELRELAAHPKAVAIGEIGLDYYWQENPSREKQKEALRAQLSLARELKLPVIIHDRDAHADAMEAVQAFPDVRGVFHCYSGSVETARQLLKMGWMLSFNGALTFKNARRAPEVVAEIPLDRIMIETDAPFLAPEPYRGRRNDSGYVYLVAEKIAAIKGISPGEVERITWENGKRFFGIQ
ncbi:MAG: TatD family hydrolase [Oscillospiraceae bacterium]|nr:TatD family hydrolase [Oscillospiraceae bacterium]